jgi:penicillin G amidase
MRILLRTLLGLLFVVMIAIAGGYLWLRSSLPQTDRTITVPGLDTTVTIARDAHGVPTIEAASDRDAAFGLGFVHAQDRLFQMDLTRRAAAGRLSEWFGPPALDTDKSMRTLGLYRAAQVQYAVLSPELRAVFDAYTAGVNAFLATRHGALPPEYQLLRVAAEPWQPVDSLAWGKIMDLQLTGNYRQELLRARLAQRLKPDDLAVLYPDYRPDAPVVLGALDPNILKDVLPGLPEPMPASNEWVVDGKHSASGKPLLANDTHLAFSAPGVWYLARIETPQDTIAGVTSPGEPLIVLGHNSHVAWGFTTTGGDVEDLFVEKLDPADPTHYLTPEGSRPFETRSEKILVSGADPVTLTVRSTRHGPVIRDGDSGEVLALAATWLQGDDRTPQALWDATHAHDWQSFRGAFKNAVAPEQNIAYADIDGHIGFTAPAAIPIRAQGDGTAPVPGWTSENDWTGMVPFDQLPSGFDPPKGRFVAANNKIVPDSYPYLISHYWELPYRAERISELLDKAPLQTPDTAAAMQADVDSIMARRLLPLMLKATPRSLTAQDAMRRLRAWDQRMTRDKAEPLLFIGWLREFNRQILSDKLGPLFDAYWALHPDVIENVLTRHPDWCDNRETQEVETCPQQLGAALDRTMDDLARRYGPDMSGWRWGNAHAASFAHAIWSRLPVVAAWLSLAIPDDGSFDTIDNATMFVGNDAQPFTAVHGPTMRMIVDLAAPEAARFMIVPGQSGNLISPHYSDLMPVWRDVGYISFGNDSGGGVLTLAPP